MPSLDATLRFMDLSSRPAAEAEQAVAELLAEEARTPFDLASGPLSRATLLRLSSREHRLVWTTHHLAADGWSTNVLLDELATLYSAERAGRLHDLPPAPRFSVYAAAQAAGGEDKEESERYWLQELADAPAALELPTDWPRPAAKSYAGATARGHVSRALTGAVKATGAASGCTLFTTLLAAFGALLHRLTGQEDLVIGIPAAAQSSEGYEGLVGHCVNFLPVRLRALGDPLWRDYLKGASRKVLDAYEHQSTTYGALIRRLELPRDPSRLPLVEVQFNLERVGAGQRFEGLQSSADPNPKAFVNSDMFLNVVETPEGLTLDFDYNTDLFDGATVARWIAHYRTLLEAIAARSSETVFGLPVWTESERRQVLVEWNDTAFAYPRHSTLSELFEAQTQRTPEAIAVEMLRREADV